MRIIENRYYVLFVVFGIFLVSAPLSAQAQKLIFVHADSVLAHSSISEQKKDR